MTFTSLYLQILVASLCLHGTAWYLLTSALSSGVWKCLLFGTGGLLSMSVSLLYFWALSHRPSPHLSFLVFNCSLFIVTLLKLTGPSVVTRTLESWKKPRKFQEELLQKIIGENGDTEYGKQFNLRAIRSLEDFRKVHPLTTYEHYRPYVERMMNGQNNVITKKAPTSYARTTGTTGKSKHIPYVSRIAAFQTIGAVSERAVQENVPALGPFQRRLFLYVHPHVSKANSGATKETIASLMDIPDVFYGMFTTPGPGLQLQTIYEANYIHLLFALREKDLGTIQMTFLTFLENAIEQLKNSWRELLLDLENGTINLDLKLPNDNRKRLLIALGRGDPGRAKELKREFEKGFSGILTRIWPRLQVVIGIDRTNMWSKIETKYAQGVTFLSGGYVCSEGFFGACLGPSRIKEIAYLPLPTDTVAEFIKEEDIGQSQPKTYLLDEVVEGECYEIVLTQAQSCLYRYRLGDVIKITGFYENCPYFKFMYRTGQMLNLIYEKLDQNVVMEAIKSAVKRWQGASFVDFVVAESTLVPEDYTELPGHETTPYYLIFIQIEGDKLRSSPNISADEKIMIDEELRLRNGDFDRLRREGLISHPRVYSLFPSAFNALQEHIVANSNASILQYKIPQKLRLFPMVQVMLEHSYKE
ncbi:uncharacterized protein LOC129275938 [Lytechinus pictus]|uniref:uncharacterized protein LOC129275938 n=1 Tax=Lytechinus pictus TaxID=7653 RepID=UPI0030B9B3AF